ncbi:MAG: hypothetical protein J4G04_07975 [Nitrosopumilaceae archaeon]|nr:hypothetical protein [Nitrosopumilaceae archaeon]
MHLRLQSPVGARALQVRVEVVNTHPTDARITSPNASSGKAAPTISGSKESKLHVVCGPDTYDMSTTVRAAAPSPVTTTGTIREPCSGGTSGREP